MAWTAPATAVTGDVITAAFWNTNGRDNLLETMPAKVTTQGDLVYATAANAIARLAKGTAAQKLRMNSGATAPEWGPAHDFLLVFGAGNNGGFAMGGTQFIGLTSLTTESNAEIRLPACTLSQLRVSSGGSPGAGQSYTFTVRKNAADTALTAAITDTNTSADDLSNSFTVSAGDRVAVKVVGSGAPANTGGFYATMLGVLT